MQIFLEQGSTLRPFCIHENFKDKREFQEEEKLGRGLKSRNLESWKGKQTIPGSLPQENL